MCLQRCWGPCRERRPGRGPDACAEVTGAVGGVRSVPAQGTFLPSPPSAGRAGGPCERPRGPPAGDQPRARVCRGRLLPRGRAQPPRRTRGRLTLFSRPSMASMPLWLRYSSRRFTRHCRPSILVSRLLCGESQQLSGRVGCGGNGFGAGRSHRHSTRKGPERGSQREQGRRSQPAGPGSRSCTRGQGLYAELGGLDALGEGRPRLT